MYLNNSSNNKVQNNDYGLGGPGITLVWSRSNLIKNNTIFSSAQIPSFGFYIYKSNYNSIINNYISDKWSDSYRGGSGFTIEHSSYNFLKGNTVMNCTGWGIGIGFCTSNLIVSNTVIQTGDRGISMYDVTNTIISSNIFIANNLLIDEPRFIPYYGSDSEGYNNTFSHNYWSIWTSPDEDEDGIVDDPYPIFTSSNDIEIIIGNYDYSPRTTPTLSIEHYCTPPIVLFPNGRETLTTSFTISWASAFDTMDHTILYTVYYSSDSGESWHILVEDLTGIEYFWDIKSLSSSADYLVKVVAYCSEGCLASDVSNEVFAIIIQDPFTSTHAFTFLSFSLLIASLCVIRITITFRKCLRKDI
jgi:parallel beta-helix repeat protein